MSSNPQYVISFPKECKESCSDFTRIKYFPVTQKVCLPDVLMVIGKEPTDYMEKYKENPEMVRQMQDWQLKWTEMKEDARKEHSPTCAVCGIKPLKTLRCAACIKDRIEVVYCSTECRDSGWREHKVVCLKKAPPSLIAELKNVMKYVWKLKIGLIK